MFRPGQKVRCIVFPVELPKWSYLWNKTLTVRNISRDGEAVTLMEGPDYHFWNMTRFQSIQREPETFRIKCSSQGKK